MTSQTITPDITEKAAENIGMLFGDFSFQDVVEEIVSGTFSPDSQNLINRLISVFLGEL